MLARLICWFLGHYKGPGVCPARPKNLLHEVDHLRLALAELTESRRRVEDELAIWRTAAELSIKDRDAALLALAELVGALPKPLPRDHCIAETLADETPSPELGMPVPGRVESISSTRVAGID